MRYDGDDIRRLDSGTLYVKLPTRMVFLWTALDDARKAWTPLRRHVRRAFTLLSDRDHEDRTYDLERLDWFIDDLEEWARAIRAEVDALRGDLPKLRRIELLRQTTGRTPEEAAAFHAKADQLEQEMKRR